MKQYAILKPFNDETGEHVPGEPSLSLSDSRATTLKKRGYVGSAIEEEKTITVNVDVDSEGTHNALNEAVELLTSKTEEFNKLSEKYDNLDEHFIRLDTAYAEQTSAFTGFVSSVKLAKDISEVKTLITALDQIESAK